ncbi:MAG TPA: FAD-binding protein [Patescibacteria group bacterium]
MKLRDHVPLREVDWFHTGGVAEYYVECQTLAEVIEATKQAAELGVEYRVIGEASNLLMSDGGYPGLIIQNRASSIVFLHDRSQIIVDSGTLISTLVSQTISQGYSGLEFLAGVPGTIGGAVYGNATAFGRSISEHVRAATLLAPSSKTDADPVRRVDRDWFAFGYRTSKLKQLRESHSTTNGPVILSVTLQLSKMSYSSCLQRMHYYQKMRASYPIAQPKMLYIFDSLCLTGEEVSQRTMGGRRDVPCHLIERNNLRQCKVNEIISYPKNPNFIINTGVGTSRDAAVLIEYIEQALGPTVHPLVSHIERVGLWDTPASSSVQGDGV